MRRERRGRPAAPLTCVLARRPLAPGLALCRIRVELLEGPSFRVVGMPTRSSPGARFVFVVCTLNVGRAHRSVSLGVGGDSPDARLLMCAARSYAHSSQKGSVLSGVVVELDHPSPNFSKQGFGKSSRALDLYVCMILWQNFGQPAQNSGIHGSTRLPHFDLP